MHRYSKLTFVALIGLGLGAWDPAGGSPSQSLFLRDGLAAAAEERTAEPATVEAAAQVLDLRTFPVIEGARVGEMRSLGMLNYEALGGAKTAFEFQQKKLQERGWKELPGAYIDAANASSKFAKNGFVVAVSTSNNAGDPQKAGWSHVFLVNHGNVAVGKLPVPPGVKPFHPNVTQASYITEAKVAETAAACRKLLLAAAWEPYGSAGSPESPMMYFKRNAIQLTAWVSSAPAAGGKTLIRYDTALLSADLPVPPDAPDPRYTDFQKTLRFDWPGEEAEAVVAFYQERLPAQGWKATTERPVSDKKQQFLIFRNPQGDLLSLDLTKYTGIVRVKLQQQTAVEVAEMDRRLKAEQERHRQELAKKSVKIKIAVPLPALADNVEQQDANRFEFTLGTSGGPAAFRRFREHFRQAGWTEEEGTQTEANIGSLRFKKGEASLAFSYIDSGVTDAEITVSGSSELVLEPTPMLDKSPRREAASKTATRDPQQPKLSNIPGLPQLPADMELPDMPDIGGLLKTLQKKQAKQPASGPSTGQRVASPPKTAGGVRLAATPITVAEQKQTRATLWVGDNTYKLEHGVAYETKLYDEPVTEVLLAVKPIAVDKLVTLLRQGKDAGDAIAFEPHVKLRFDASGKLAYLFLFADGLSVNLGNPEPNVVKAEVTVKDGRARGTAVMDKPGALFKQQYRIHATFDAKLATGPAAASDAATE